MSRSGVAAATLLMVVGAALVVVGPAASGEVSVRDLASARGVEAEPVSPAAGHPAAPGEVLPGEVPLGEVDLARLQPGDLVAVEEVGEPVALPRPAIAAQRRAAGPSRVTVPALDASMPLVQAPTRAGRLAVPPGVSAVGYASQSARPGANRGTTLLATHRDTGSGGRGVRSPLYDAPDLAKGARIHVAWLGQHTKYRVTEVTRHPRGRLPSRLASVAGTRHRLALVTCGGPLVVDDDRRLRWSQTVIVWAKPIGGRAR